MKRRRKFWGQDYRAERKKSRKDYRKLKEDKEEAKDG